MNRKLIIGIIIAVIVGAVATTTIFVTRSANDIDRQLELGQRYLEDGDYEEAIIAFERAIEIDEANVEARMGLVAALVEIGEVDDAIDQLIAVIDIEDDNAEAYIQLAELLIEQGDLEEALEWIQEGITQTEDEALYALLDSLRPEPPVASVESGTYEESFDVSISSGDNDIYFTMDGSEVSMKSEQYRESLGISEDIILSMIAVNDLGLESDVKTYTYTYPERTETEEENIDLLAIDDPEKVIEFVDAGFEQHVREWFLLGNGDIKWKDIGYRTELFLGYISDISIRSLEDLKWFVNLKILDAYPSNNFSVEGNLLDISKLSNLEELRFSRTAINGNLENIASLRKISILDLNECHHIQGDISDLSRLIDLRWLFLLDTNITGDLSDLEYLVNLEAIDLQSTSITGNIGVFSKMNNLKSISLNNPFVTGNLEVLSGLTNISHLWLPTCDINGDLSSLGLLTDLQVIGLGGTSVTGDLLDLEGFTKLRDLLISETMISGNINELRDMQFLKYLSLSDTKVTGDLGVLDDLDQLEWINVVNTDITGEVILLDGTVYKVD